MKALSMDLFALFLLVYSGADAQVKTLVLGEVIEKPMSEGERHTYQLALESGQFVHITVEQIGVDVVITVLGPNGEKIEEVDAPTGTQGTENVMIEVRTSGTHQLEIHPFKSEGYEGPLVKGKYKVQIEELLSAAEYKKRLETERARHEATIQWLKEHAIPLKGVEAEQGLEDMQPLKQIIGSARLVALGEATHGTREFFQLKHRILEFLVTEMGFNIFGIEATMPEGFDLNEYVLTGKGDPEKALAGLYFWTWNTEEVLEMIRWMRRYNSDPNHSKKVKFYGFDMQSGTRAFKVLEKYLNQVDHKAAEALSKNASLALLKNAYTEQDFGDTSKEEKLSALNVIATMIKQLETNKAKYLAQTGEKDWEIARLHAIILSQYIQSNIDFTAGSAIRDSSMAENIRWIMEHEGLDDKMVIWAHNYHVSTEKTGAVASMGHHLRKMYGKDMIIFGFAFHQGSFQAIEMPFGSGRGLRPFHVKPLPEESLDATLGATGLPYAAIDLQRLPAEGSVAEWFAKPHQTRSFGAGFSPQAASSFAGAQQVTALYDALLIVDETTAARPNPGGTRTTERNLTSPENLEFESSEPGLIPQGWNAHKYRLANFDFNVETSAEHPQQGKNCLKISRKSGKHYGETFGSLSQRLDATPYRGKRIKLRAAVRTEVEGSGNHAYLWLTIEKQGFGPQSTLFKDSMKDRPITTREWHFFEINCEVPDEAPWINFGMALTGEGSAWFDSFSLEMVEPQKDKKSQ
jgi:erythromycin esterase